VRFKVLQASAVFILFTAAAVQTVHAFDIPEDALRLIAETTIEPCSICARQNMEKAFSILNGRLVPGLVMKSDDGCRLMKTGPGDDNELALSCYPSDAFMKTLKNGEEPPRIVFRFSTPGNRLVGVSERDYTGRDSADLYRTSKPGTEFEGSVRLIHYNYGDGPAYNYFPKTNTLLIHCVILELAPVKH
jgi:hypothetical protein